MVSKKGESIIEVLVAFGILTLVMTGVLSMASSLLVFAQSSRSTTRAASLAQEGLARGNNILNHSCNSIRRTADVNTGVISVLVPEVNTDDYQLQVTLEEIDTIEQETAFTSQGSLSTVQKEAISLNTSNGFHKIVSRVTWNDPGVGNRTYIISEIINGI